MTSTFDEMIELAARLAIEVRHAHLGGNGGGLVKLKGSRKLFIDLDACAQDQLEQTAQALASADDLETIFVRPDVRELIEKARSGNTP